MSTPQTVRVCRDTHSTEEKELGLPPLNISVFGQTEKNLPGNYVLCGVWEIEAR